MKAVGIGSAGFKKDVPIKKSSSSGSIYSVVTNVIKNVVRNDWEISAKNSNTSIVLLNKISDFMKNEMSMDYEALCMKNIAAHAQVMPKEDLRQYVSMLEALQTGYKTKYGQELANLLMLGVTSVARDSQSAKKHLDSLLGGIYGSAEACNAAAVKESTKVQDLSRELETKERSVINRIFKKGEIRTIRKRIDVRKNRIAKIEKKKEKHLGLAKTLKGIASNAPSKA
jgi:hypothetical protein